MDIAWEGVNFPYSLLEARQVKINFTDKYEKGLSS